MRTPLLAGNWKMYKTVAEARTLVDGLLAGLQTTEREVLVCPPFTALHAMAPLLHNSRIALGAQDLFYEAEGAYTGAVSGKMLVDVGCQYVIVGHSERRQIFGDTDETVNRKLLAALGYNLRPILCVGESKPQRDSGQAVDVVTGQVRADLSGISAAQMADLVIAYEPIWAIGTGDTATPQDAQDMHAAIRGLLAELYDDSVAAATRILYGGSVKPDNIDELMAQPDLDGALVGGASLKPDSFLRIIHYVA